MAVDINGEIFYISKNSIEFYVCAERVLLNCIVAFTDRIRCRASGFASCFIAHTEILQTMSVRCVFFRCGIEVIPISA